MGIGRATELSLGIGRTAEFEVRISGPNKEVKQRIRDCAGPLFSYCAKPLFLAVEQAERNAIAYAWRGEYAALRIDEHDVDFGVLCGEL